MRLLCKGKVPDMMASSPGSAAPKSPPPPAARRAAHTTVIATSEVLCIEDVLYERKKLVEFYITSTCCCSFTLRLALQFVLPRPSPTNGDNGTAAAHLVSRVPTTGRVVQPTQPIAFMMRAIIFLKSVVYFTVSE